MHRVIRKILGRKTPKPHPPKIPLKLSFSINHLTNLTFGLCADFPKTSSTGQTRLCHSPYSSHYRVKEGQICSLKIDDLKTYQNQAVVDVIG